MRFQPGVHLPGGPVRPWQLAVVFLPFLLPLLYAFLTTAIPPTSPLRIGPWLVMGIFVPLLGLMVVAFIAGLVRQFPLWTLPAL